jgi:hypothetical protein
MGPEPVVMFIQIAVRPSIRYGAAFRPLHNRIVLSKGQLRARGCVEGLFKKMSGTVEVDETYVGGYQKGHQGRPNVENSNKTPVLELVERGGNVRSFPLERTTLKNIKPILKKAHRSEVASGDK